MNSRVKDAIVVHLERNQESRFTQCGHGLYYFDTAIVRPVKTPHNKITNNDTIDKSKIAVTGYPFVSTVSTNKEYFTRREN